MISVLALGITLWLSLCPAGVQGACTLSTTGVNFGAYNPLDGVNVDSTGTISIQCTEQSIVSIAIGPSPTAGGFNPRKMQQTAGPDLLNYNLYTTSARTSIWGNGTQGTVTVSQNISKRKIFTQSVYGRIPAGQDIYLGQYGETLVVTIDYY
jgi:spore coat protein U-like protein